MKIQKFNEKSEIGDRHIYVYMVSNNSRTYRGSIWDSPSKPWIPDNSKLITDFNLPDGYSFMTVTQEELDEINEIKDKRDSDQNSKKFNI